MGILTKFLTCKFGDGQMSLAGSGLKNIYSFKKDIS